MAETAITEIDFVKKDWTIMVYMAGDNNLSENMAFSLEDLRTVTGSKDVTMDKVNVLSFFDSNSLTAPTIYTDYSDATIKNPPKPHYVTQDDLVYPKREKLPKNVPKPLIDGDSSSAYSIMNFVHWCISEQNRTAENYAIIFSGHSFGFHGTSLLRDEDSGGSMTIFKLQWALKKIIDNYLGKRFAIIGFDSCVMSMIEIGFQLKNVAQTMVASEGSLPNSGWSYTPMLKTLIEDHNVDVNLRQSQKMLALDYFPSGRYIKEAAFKFVEAFVNQHKNLVIGGRSIDISAWDLDEVPDLATAVNDLAIKFNDCLYLAKKVEDKQLNDVEIREYNELKKIILQAHYDTQTYMHEQCIDLKDFCKRLFLELKFIQPYFESKKFDAIRKQCKKIIKLVDNCVIKSGFCGDEYQFSNGISMYFPWSYLTFSLTNHRYRWMEINRGVDNYKVDTFEEMKGDGKDWYRFLFIYLTRVTTRSTRKNEDGEVSALEDFSENSPMWSGIPITSSDNLIWSRDNPRASRDNPPASRDNPRASRDNPPASRDNPRASRGELGNYLFYFSRYKNYALRWNVSGFADEFAFSDAVEKDKAEDKQ